MLTIQSKVLVEEVVGLMGLMEVQAVVVNIDALITLALLHPGQQHSIM